MHPGHEFDAYAVAALTAMSVADVRRHLDILSRAHLVEAVRGERYGMHDLLRDYAASLVADLAGCVISGAQDLRDRLFEFYLVTAAAAMDRLYPAEAVRRPRVPFTSSPIPPLAEPDAARTWLNTELPTLTALSGDAVTYDRPEFATVLSRVLFRYLDGGHFSEAATIHGHAYEAAHRANDVGAQVHALNSLAMVQWHLGRHQAAHEHLHQALALGRGGGDRLGEARTLANLGISEGRVGRFRSAATHFAQAVGTFRSRGDLAGEARASTNLGTAEERQDQNQSAIEHMQRALELHEQAGNLDGQAHALAVLGDTSRKMGQPGQAADYHQQALNLWQRLGARSGEAWVLDTLGSDYALLSQPDRATDYHQQALTIFRELGEQNGEAESLNGLGEAAATARRFVDSVAHHCAALTISTDSGIGDQQARAQIGLGRAYQALGDPERARHHYQDALVTCAAFDLPNADDIHSLLAAAGATTPPHTDETA